MKKALIAMSGGVDSSVAAFLAKSGGCDCIGCTMKLFERGGADGTDSRSCCTLEDAEDARGVARRLGMPFYVFNFTERFGEEVMRRFAESYLRGETPNPCIDCNRCLKFGALFERARLLGCDYIVTGHYARIAEEGGRFALKKAVDRSKDQSYVLYMLTQEQLAHTLLPLGGLSKEEVRAIAAEQGFSNAAKPDSQDICFVPDGDHARMIEEFTGEKAPEGDFLDSDGNVLGRHRGITRYTVGQRRGLGVSASQALYVKEIDPLRNTVTLAPDSALYSREVDVRGVNWIAGEPPTGETRCAAKIRYRHAERPALLIPSGADRARIVFDEPQRAVTRGQSAVFYDGDAVLGGGEIC